MRLNLVLQEFRLFNFLTVYVSSHIAINITFEDISLDNTLCVNHELIIGLGPLSFLKLKNV